MQQLTNGIMFEDSFLGVTVGALVYSHGAILVDAPLRAEDTRSWRSAMLNHRSGSNRLLVSLDAHPDRTLGTRALECPIVAHQRAAHVFRNRPTIFKGQSVETGAVWEVYSDAIGMRWASPDITFSERMSLHWGGPEVILEYIPGPTPGSIWVHIPDSQVVFVGDLVVLNQPPFLAQADLDAWIAGLDRLIGSFSQYKIIGGRGGLATLDDLAGLRQTLADIAAAIEALAAKNSVPEATQELAANIMSHYSVPGKLRDLYNTRLRYGLYQCFTRRFRPSSAQGLAELEFEEQ